MAPATTTSDNTKAMVPLTALPLHHGYLLRCGPRFRYSGFRVPLQPLQIGANVGGVLVTKIPIFLQTPC